jgi:hypothetical protein
MSNVIDFRDVKPPQLHLIRGDLPPELGPSGKWPEGFIVRVLSGSRMHNKVGALAEIAAALQFPTYFGANWDALDECISDLEWLPAAGYVIVVLKAEELLKEERQELPNLVSILRDASAFWTSRKLPIPFHIVFCCAEGGMTDLQMSLLGVPYSTS